MFRRVLLPVDLSDRHAPALDLAARLCQPGEGEVTLLHVVETIPGLSVEEERPFYDRLERAARKHLDRLGCQLGGKSVRWHGVVCLGHRVEQVAARARQEQADLVIVTTPPPEPDSARAGLASLSFRIGLVAPCPVLLARASRSGTEESERRARHGQSGVA